MPISKKEFDDNLTSIKLDLDALQEDMNKHEAFKNGGFSEKIQAIGRKIGNVTMNSGAVDFAPDTSDKTKNK